MKEVRINGANMIDKATAHAYLKRKLALPDYYGDNLDALWDCLSTDVSEINIIIYNTEILINNLGSYGVSIIRLLQEVTEENKSIQVSFDN